MEESDYVAEESGVYLSAVAAGARRRVGAAEVAFAVAVVVGVGQLFQRIIRFLIGVAAAVAGIDPFAFSVAGRRHNADSIVVAEGRDDKIFVRRSERPRC